MTLDYPDWSRVASGTVRYLGHVHALGAGGSAQATYTILPSERSLVYMLAVPTTAPVLVQASGASGFTTRQCNFGTFAGLNQNIPMAVPVAASIDTSWTVSVSAPGPAGSADVYVFASTDPAPLANPAYPQPVAVSDGTNLLIGQQAAASSLPVVLPSDQAALPLSMLDGAAGTTATVRGSVAGGIVVSTRKALIPAAVNGTANASATLTIPAGGLGNYAYITRLRIVRVATAALAGSAALNISTTNLGGRTWTVGNAMAAGGTQVDLDADFTVPLRGAVSNTGCTVVMPAAGAAVSWYASAEYYYDTAVT